MKNFLETHISYNIIVATHPVPFSVIAVGTIMPMHKIRTWMADQLSINKTTRENSKKLIFCIFHSRATGILVQGKLLLKLNGLPYLDRTTEISVVSESQQVDDETWGRSFDLIPIAPDLPLTPHPISTLSSPRNWCNASSTEDIYA